MSMSVELVDINSSEDQGSCDVEVDHIPPLSEVSSNYLTCENIH